MAPNLSPRSASPVCCRLGPCPPLARPRTSPPASSSAAELVDLVVFDRRRARAGSGPPVLGLETSHGGPRRYRRRFSALAGPPTSPRSPAGRQARMGDPRPARALCGSALAAQHRRRDLPRQPDDSARPRRTRDGVHGATTTPVVSWPETGGPTGRPGSPTMDAWEGAPRRRGLDRRAVYEDGRPRRLRSRPPPTSSATRPPPSPARPRGSPGFGTSATRRPSSRRTVEDLASRGTTLTSCSSAGRRMEVGPSGRARGRGGASRQVGPYGQGQ